MKHPYITAFLLLLVCTMIFLTPLATAWAATLEELHTKVNQLQETKKISDQAQEEIKNYREYIKNENDRLFNMFITILTFISIMVPGIIFGFGYFFGQSRKEQLDEIRETKRENREELNKIRETLKSKHQVELDQLQKEHEKDLENKLKEIRKEYKEEYEKELRKLQNDVQDEIDTLQSLIQKEKGYLSSRILVIGRDEDLLAMEKNEMEIMRSRGIKQIDTMPYDKEQLQKKLRFSQYDILIYRYLNNDETPYHIEIVQMLKQGKYQIPYLIYGRDIPNPDMAKLNEYTLCFISNFPSTLITNLFSLAYAFNPSRSTDSKEHPDD